MLIQESSMACSLSARSLFVFQEVIQLLLFPITAILFSLRCIAHLDGLEYDNNPKNSNWIEELSLTLVDLTVVTGNLTQGSEVEFRWLLF